MSVLILPGTGPFIAAIFMMVTLGVLELIALLIGLSVTERAGSFLLAHLNLDHDGGADSGAVGQCLSWLHVGRIPFLVVLTLLLLGFAIAGMSLQYAMHACLGFSLSTPLAVACALPASLLFTRYVGGWIGRFVPSVESSALSEAEFVGSTARFIGATASRGVPGQACFVDRFGQTHYVRVEPLRDDEPLTDGMRVVIVERVSDSLYRAAQF